MEKARRNDAFVCGTGSIEGVQVSAGFFAFEFMGGSMGSVVGEKVTMVFEKALELQPGAPALERMLETAREAHRTAEVLTPPDSPPPPTP